MPAAGDRAEERLFDVPRGPAVVAGPRAADAPLEPRPDRTFGDVDAIGWDGGRSGARVTPRRTGASPGR